MDDTPQGAELLTSEEAAEHTPEELLEREDGHRYELIDGRLIERHMGAESSEVAATVIHRVREHARARKLGKVFATDCGYQIFPDEPRRVRYPDMSFVAHGRFPDDRTPAGHVTIPPDLAAEVVSPNDTAEEVEAKRIQFLKAGTRLLWVIYPQSRTVHVYRLDGSCAVLAEGDTLSGEDVLPEFSCRVAELFEDA